MAVKSKELQLQEHLLENQKYFYLYETVKFILIEITCFKFFKDEATSALDTESEKVIN